MSDLLVIRPSGGRACSTVCASRWSSGRSFDMAAQALFVRLPPASRAALAKQAERWSSATLTRLPGRLARGERPRDAPTRESSRDALAIAALASGRSPSARGAARAG